MGHVLIVHYLGMGLLWVNVFTMSTISSSAETNDLLKEGL